MIMSMLSRHRQFAKVRPKIHLLFNRVKTFYLDTNE